jgi:hypothetical protein
MANKFIQATELPYISHIPTDGRKIPLLGYYDSDAVQFYAYSSLPDGRILVLPAVELQEGTYIAKAAAKPELDYHLFFSEKIIQHFSFNDIAFTLNAIERDLLNGLASIHEYFVLLNYSNQYKDHADYLMVRTSVEYAFGNHRAFYDLLHEVICKIHRKYQKRVPSMKDSFEYFATKSVADLREKFLFPEPIINFYKSRVEIFLKLRQIRNNIYHHGHSPDMSFKFPDGFAFRVDDRFATELGDLNLWPDELLKPNRLGSVLAILEYLERDMLDAALNLGNSLLLCFTMPPQPIAPDYKIFLRSVVSKHLVSLDKYRQTHWFDPQKILGV